MYNLNTEIILTHSQIVDHVMLFLKDISRFLL